MKKNKCKYCNKELYKKESFRCSECGQIYCGDHIYTRVDGNNISITKNAREFCWGCYSRQPKF